MQPSCGLQPTALVLLCRPPPPPLQLCREFEDGGIAVVEMLFRCNIFCLVGGGPTPKFPPTKAIIYDDHQGRAIGELSFRNNVCAMHNSDRCTQTHVSPARLLVLT